MSIRQVNGAVFMIWSLPYRNSRRINIGKATTPYTTDFHKSKFTKFYQINQLWWELYSRECGEGLTDVKREGADIEKI